MEELLKHLNSINPLSENLVSYLATNLKTRNLRKKDFLLKKGHVSRDIYFVNKGLLRCFYLVDDKEISSWFMKEGDVIISVESFFQQAVSKESIQALEECTVYYITYQELQYTYRTFPEFNAVGRVLTERYYTLSEQRLYSIRGHKAQERFNFLQDNYPELILRVPSKYLASYLGITDVHFSNMKGNN